MHTETSRLGANAAFRAAACRNPCHLLPLLLGFWLALHTSGSAAPLATETFETYSTGALSGQGGGTGWAANWGTSTANVVDTTSNPLSYAVIGGTTINGQTRAVQMVMQLRAKTTPA